ncbi:Eco57I restriction-modification methylase domain-containing protein [Yinghuangia sp. YIM S09857]|uniref:Eco57I restriction-modification methylase domain-containing protein n=1 Tax=Yinghuangia sp. YIM S09857 TaxID=3436929 RepID=UPI003F538173
MDKGTQVELGQFFTPAPVADYLASLARLPSGGTLRVLDPGAGAGSLSAALVARVLAEQPEVKVTLTACEVDKKLSGVLQATLDDCEQEAGALGGSIATEALETNFIGWAADDGTLFPTQPERFDLVIMNPPYRKLARASRERRLVEATAVEVSNLYAAFLALGVRVLNPGGQLVAITPRSFTNGAYFRAFRRFFLDHMDLDLLHVYESRTSAFADSDVLQENVILSAVRRDGPQSTPVVISLSDSHHHEPQRRTVPFADVVHPADPEAFIHISADDEDAELAAALAALPSTLADLELQVSTGKVVDFRAKDHLRDDPEPGSIPLIYPLHMRNGRVTWPVAGAKKSNAIMLNEATKKLAVPSGHYVVVKRMSSKEERRRVVAALFDPAHVPCEAIGFENHVNVFNRRGAGLPADLAAGLLLWLNSSLLDRLIRRFSGHTQINATDLRNLRYPSAAQLRALGAAWAGGTWPSQDQLDELVDQHVGGVPV